MPLRLLFGGLGRVLPFAACGGLARLIAPLFWLMGFRRAITLRNLELAFPEATSRQRRRIARASYVNVLTVFLEMLTLRWMSKPQLQGAISIDNIELLEPVDGRGSVLLSAHYGNWELLAIGAGAFSSNPFSVVVTEQNDQGQLAKMRTAFGNQLIPTGRGARGAAAVLRQGGAVAMLADQSARGGEVRVRIFGVESPWFSSPARLALRFNARVIVGYAVRTDGGHYHARLEEIRHDDLNDDEEGVRTLVERYVRTLESVITCHPEQWVWQHRRFKHVPGVEYDPIINR